MASQRDTAGALKCPLCGARALRFTGTEGRCGACGFAGPAHEVVRHVETELEKLRTRYERIVHERRYNTEYLLRELADARRAINRNTLYIAGAVLATLAVGWLLHPWDHSEHLYLVLVCAAFVTPLYMKRRWLRGVLKDKEQDIGERIRDVAADLDGKAKALAAEIDETEEFLANITGGT